MPRRPAADERLVVPARSGVTSERVYLTELAQYLRHPVRLLRQMAKQHGLLKRVTYGGRETPRDYVTTYGAQRLIAWARACQGELYLQGHDWAGARERNTESWRRIVQKKLANLAADTEAEPRSGAGRKAKAESFETAVVCMKSSCGSHHS